MSTSDEADQFNLTQDTRPSASTGSKYRLIHLAAQRAKQITKGAKPRVALNSADHKPTYIALAEIKEQKLGFQAGEELGDSPEVK